MQDTDGQIRKGTFTVVRCRASDHETIQYFLSVCQIIIRHLGKAPSRTAIAAAVRRIASIFQNIRKPPVRSLNGLFGELYLISRSRTPSQAVAAWRIDESSRFDFAAGDVRIDVKSCTGRLRVHTFSYDQCNPPPSTHAVVASLMVERLPRGLSLEHLVLSIEAQVSGDEELVLKLYEIIASTLGASVPESMRVTFDPHLAESSLQFFDLREIPAIRGNLPPRVSDVRFTVDMSGLLPLSEEVLVDRDALFWDLVPAIGGHTS